MMSKLLQFKSLVATLFLLACVAVPVHAQFFANGLYYDMRSFDEVIVTASPYGDKYSGDITIPSTVTVWVSYYYEEYEVTCTVVGVGYNAFRDCDGLTSVELPATAYVIDAYAFYNCPSLTSIELPEGMGYIGDEAFGYCTGLRSMTIPDNASLGWGVFYGCSGLNEVSLPDGLTSLYGTFKGCSSLTTIQLPASLEYLDGAFTGCTSLQSITVPRRVSYIGERTFEGCSSLTTVILPASLTYIDSQAFLNCDNLTQISCMSKEPPTMSRFSDYFSELVYDNARLHVPSASIESYKVTNWWNLFKNIYGLIYFNTSSAVLAPGEQLQLTPMFAPGYESTMSLQWSSSNNAVATVSSDGLVEAIAAGEAFIYAAYDGEIATCSIQVKSGTDVPGDLNGDGTVNIADVNAMISCLLSGSYGDQGKDFYDVNGDGAVNIADLNGIIAIILGY